MSGGGVITTALREVVERNRTERDALDAAVLKAVTTTEATLHGVVERVGWRHRSAKKVDGSLRRLVEAGSVAVRLEGRLGGQGTRMFKLPEGA